MADYAQHVNFSTLDNLSTTSRYDSDISKWVNDSALWHKNAAGILVATGYDNPLPTELTGSINTERTVIVNAEAITDTAIKIYPLPDISQYKDWELYYTDSHVDGSSNPIQFSIGIGLSANVIRGSSGYFYASRNTSASTIDSFVVKTTAIKHRLRIPFRDLMLSSIKFYKALVEQTDETLTATELERFYRTCRDNWQTNASSRRDLYIAYNSAPASGALTVELVGVK